MVTKPQVYIFQNCKYILVLDVTAMDDRNLTNYGDHLSGWWLLGQRWNPFASPVKIPDQSEIQMRLAFCSHYKNLEELKRNPNYEYIKLPSDKYSSSAVRRSLMTNFNCSDFPTFLLVYAVRRDPRDRLSPRKHVLRGPAQGQSGRRAAGVQI